MESPPRTPNRYLSVVNQIEEGRLRSGTEYSTSSGSAVPRDTSQRAEDFDYNDFADYALLAHQDAVSMRRYDGRQSWYTYQLARLYRTITSDLIWLVLILIGCFGALATVVVDQFTEWIIATRYSIVFGVDVWLVRYVSYIGTCILLLMSAAALTRLGPSAAGSGIPEMKSVLSGVVIPDYMSLRTLLVKMGGICLAYGAGISIGREGPFVHITSCLSNLLLRHIPSFHRIYRNEQMRLQVLAAACAVGVSASFGAPIGGVLFSIEVTSTYYMVQNLWKGFFTAVCGSVVIRLVGKYGLVALMETDFKPLPYESSELVAFVALGLVAGLLGKAFVSLVKYMITQCRRSLFLSSKPFLHVIMVAWVSAAIIFPFHVSRLEQRRIIDLLFSSDDLEGWDTPSRFVTLPLFLIQKLVMTSAVMTLPIPAGVFTPIFIIGAALGRLVGEMMRVGFAMKVVAGGYSVVGAAAFASAVTRTISTSVIVLELTGQLHHALPILICVLMSNMVSTALSQNSIYDQLLILKGLPYMPPLQMFTSYTRTVAEIMRRDLVYVARSTTYAELETLLAQHPKYYTFPLVEDTDDMRFVGVVQRGSIQTALMERQRKFDSEKPMHLQRAMDAHVAETAAAAAAAAAAATASGGGGGGGGAAEGAPPSSASASGEIVLPSQAIMAGAAAAAASATPNISAGNPTPPLSPDVAAGGPGTPMTTISRSGTPTPMFGGTDPTDMLDMTINPVIWDRDHFFAQPVLFHYNSTTETVVSVDPSPLTMNERTPLSKVHFWFTMLNLRQAWVLNQGTLIGVVTKSDLMTIFRKHLQ